MTKQIEILPTQNENYGFYGTMTMEWGRRNMAPVWALAFKTVAGITDWDDETIRDFLDSRMGRHLAESLLSISALENMPAAIDSAKGHSHFAHFADEVYKTAGKMIKFCTRSWVKITFSSKKDKSLVEKFARAEDAVQRWMELRKNGEGDETASLQASRRDNVFLRHDFSAQLGEPHFVGVAEDVASMFAFIAG
jgi:hypothetical protein